MNAKLRISCRGLIVHDGKVLLQNIDGRDFWNVPGGGYDMDDASLTDCVIREIQEETGITARVKKMLCVQEFHMNDLEQVEIFFHMETDNPQQYTEYFDDVDAPGVVNRLCWFEREDVQSVSLRPEYLRINMSELLDSEVNAFTQKLS